MPRNGKWSGPRAVRTVDLHGAHVEGQGDVHGGVDVAREHSGLQPVLGGVGELHRVRGVGDPDDRQDGCEGLDPGEVHSGLDVVDQGRLHEVVLAAAPDDEPGTHVDGLPHQGFSGLGSAGVDKWGDRRVVPRIAHGESADPLLDQLSKLVGHRLDDQHPLHGGAPLAGVGERPGDDVGRRGVQVGVAQHDRRVLAAELEHQRHHARLTRQLLPGLRRAGERDHVDGGVLDKKVPDA